MLHAKLYALRFLYYETKLTGIVIIKYFARTPKIRNTL